jgi:signal peptidase
VSLPSPEKDIYTKVGLYALIWSINMDKKRIKRALIGLGRDLLLAFIVVLVIMLILYAYCGVWPPMVVVESSSMQHSDERSYIGVIDTGDMVFVKKFTGVEDLVTYVDGEAMDYVKYSSFGDVIIYRPDGNFSTTPIIHRIVVWIDVNDTYVSHNTNGVVDYANYSFDVPSLGFYGTNDNVTIYDYGQDNRTVSIPIWAILHNFRSRGLEPHGGFITLGDNNDRTDQTWAHYLPVKGDWVVGRAIGELPWFGLIKLSVSGPPTDAPRNSWVNLFAIVIILIGVPFILDFGPPFIRKLLGKRKDRKNKEEKSSDARSKEEDEKGVTKAENVEGLDARPIKNDEGNVSETDSIESLNSPEHNKPNEKDTLD